MTRTDERFSGEARRHKGTERRRGGVTECRTSARRPRGGGDPVGARDGLFAEVDSRFRGKYGAPDSCLGRPIHHPILRAFVPFSVTSPPPLQTITLPSHPAELLSISVPNRLAVAAMVARAEIEAVPESLNRLTPAVADVSFVNHFDGVAALMKVLIHP